MIAITFALSLESVSLIRELRRNLIDCREVKIWHTGVGENGCDAAMAEFLRSERPDILISSGFAGAVRPGLRVGDLILGENFSDRQLIEKAEEILSDYQVKTVRVFTSGAIVDSIAERNQMARNSDAAAVDMESAVIARACARVSVPMVSLRAISDSLDQPLPAPPAVLFDMERQRTDLGKLLGYLAGHPRAILPLIKFSRQIGRARDKLAAAVVALLNKL